MGPTFRSESRTVFGPIVTDVLEPFGFQESGFQRGGFEFFVDYDNADFRVRLLNDHNGSDVLVAPPDEREHFYAVEVLLQYLYGDDLRSRSLRQLAALSKQHYGDLSTLLSKREPGAWQRFLQWLDEFNRKRFSLGRVRKST